MTKLDAGLITPLPASDLGSTAVWGSKRINPRPQSCLCLTWSGYPSNDDDDDDDDIRSSKSKHQGLWRLFSDCKLATGRPLPTNLSLVRLMRKLGRGYCLSKIDLANVYNKICLSPESQKKLALNTHKRILLQKQLSFEIKSSRGYFQEIMEQLTQNLRGVAVYFDDIFVNGDNAKDHLMNLRALFKRLKEKSLFCNREKMCFCQTPIDYLGHILSNQRIVKGSKVDAILEIPTLKNISTLKSFLSSVQFYSKFLPPYVSKSLSRCTSLHAKENS